MCEAPKPPCRCNCGYNCGGPTKCEVYAREPLRCRRVHHKTDCGHVWDGPWEEAYLYSGESESATCSHCGKIKVQHDIERGP